MRHAISTEPREVYFNFDHSWMDDVLSVRQAVSVVNIERNKLKDLRLDSLGGNEYQIVISSQTKENFDSKDTASIDSFLTNNPCWISLHDPTVLDNKAEAKYIHLGYHESAIFIRLPSTGFQATCLFYSYITKIQFPAKCPANTSMYRVAWLGGIGFANCLHPLGTYDSLCNLLYFELILAILRFCL